MEKNVKHIIAELKKCAAVPGKEKTWISALSDEQLYQVYIMLRNQRTGRYIAEHIQTAWGLHTTTSVHSLGQGIGKLKKRISHLLISPVEEAHQIVSRPSCHHGEHQRRGESLEVLADELEARIRSMMAEEQKTGVRLLLSKEVSALSSLRKTILKERQWELEHWHDNPAIMRSNNVREAHIKNQFNRLLDSLPDNGSRVVEAGEKLFQLLEENSIPMQYNEATGRYQINEEDLRPGDF